tara:strand:+ start:18069 stop:19049 length:981 start_codon:yes stop_codon:yes gene_type:complete
MKNTINLIVSKYDEGQRVDQYIASKEKNLSRTSVQNLIKKENLKINNLISANPSRKILENDQISLTIPEIKKTSLEPYDYKLNIVFEDDHLIILDKSAGISMHPGAGNYDRTIVNALINYSKGNYNFSNIGNELRPGIVHRIDKDTSGLVVIAKNNKAHENLSLQFKDHSIHRVYQLMVWGKLRPQSGKIQTLITRSSRNRQMMEVGITKGKKAVTNYKTLEVFENENIPTLSLVECKLETGRTHQIRVHMSYKNNYILGDKKYKKKFKKFKNVEPEVEKLIYNLERQFLHAKELGFIHPQNGKKLIFKSNLPHELENIVKVLKKA